MSGELIKVIAVIIVSAVFVTVIRVRAAEYSFLLTLAIIAVVLFFVLQDLFGKVSQLSNLFEQSGNTSIYFVTALKALGISYVTTFAADLCRDFGLSSLASTAETVGKITIFILSFPLVTSVLQSVLGFVGL